MKTLTGIVVVALGLFSAAAWAAPSAEQLRQASELRTQLVQLKSDIAEVAAEDAKYRGGLIKTQLQFRLATMRLTESLVNQRIQALEAGARITVEVPGTRPDPALAASIQADIDAQKDKIRSLQAESGRYSGGLIKAQLDSTIATVGSTLAFLEQKQLAARYGLAIPVQSAGQAGGAPTSAPATSAPVSSQQTSQSAIPLAEQVIKVRILSKRFSEVRLRSGIYFDLEFTPDGLDKPARAIKGSLKLRDLFGEEKLSIGWTIDNNQIIPSQAFIETGNGFEYNRFTNSHQWVNNTEISNMTASFTVQSILYQDGTRRDF